MALQPTKDRETPSEPLAVRERSYWCFNGAGNREYTQLLKTL